jgi:acetyltransferase
MLTANGVYAGGPFQLADGRAVWVRPLRADDAPRLVELCQRLSPLTVRRRFLRERTRCDPQEALDLASVDQVQRVAIAVVPQPGADGPILGVGRFHRHDSDSAELALLVRDDYQHVGIGRLLLSQLFCEADQRQLRVLDGYVLYDNAPVLGLLRTSGRPLEVRWHGGDVLQIQLSCC